MCLKGKFLFTVVCSGKEVWLINHGLGDKLAVAHTDQLISSVISSDDGMNTIVGVYHCDCLCMCIYSLCVIST